MPMRTLKIKGQLLSFDRPRIMAVYNVTPDSFFKGYLNELEGLMVEKIGQMLEQGADIIDIGGQSTRPGSDRLPAQQELDRVIPVIQTIMAHFPETFISIDTYHASVARSAIQAGASLVNDISGGQFDADMLSVVCTSNVPLCCMHIQGTPETMQQNPSYNDVVLDVFDQLNTQIQIANQAGVHDLIVDPGIGFGKTTDHNFKLLKNLSVFNQWSYPVMVGLSRKGMIYRTLGITPEDALNGTTALHMIALQQGADLLRVHDVKEARQTIDLFMAYKKATDEGG
jgi:dihydropteroate synthase